MLRGDIHVRAARLDDASDLSALAWRSKAYWGYEQSFLNACRDELTYSDEQINSAQFEFHAFELKQDIVAFYALEFDSSSVAELEAMFIEPDFIGCDLGRELFSHATSRCQARAISRLLIQADEFAADFYITMGAIQCGSRESGSIIGRHFPLFEFKIADSTSTTRGLVE
jgi:N-acetylglutamate synthase-like GNAT family acetyltransferase